MRLNPLVLLAILPLAACSHAGSSTSHDPAPAPVADAAHECKLVADSGARNARVVKPGMAVTMDFRQDRVTVQVDAQNRIERASCG